MPKFSVRFEAMPDLSPEELGDVLFACRQIARKTEREAGHERLAVEVRMKKMARADRLRSAIRKLKPRHEAEPRRDPDAEI